jgi:hypothetical protein
MVLSVTARVIDSYTGKKVVFYGYRHKRAHAARRLFATRIFYTSDSSSGRPAAYALRRVKRARRIHYVFACLPETRPNSFGRPDDPLVRQCGRARVSWP